MNIAKVQEKKQISEVVLSHQNTVFISVREHNVLNGFKWSNKTQCILWHFCH